MQKVIVLGAGGIVGQHMLISLPDDVEALFVRKSGWDQTTSASTNDVSPWFSMNLEDPYHLPMLIHDFEPDAIVNLAGENRVDVVQQDPKRYEDINVDFVQRLARWCRDGDIRLIQGSTQGVFSGENAPYSPDDEPHPITAYGCQKADAELEVHNEASDFVIARLTFVLGVRPYPEIGRRNPLEDMIEKPAQLQVNDRFFSPLWAPDAAEELWKLVDEDDPPAQVHLGTPDRTTRYMVACEMSWKNGLQRRIKAVSHEFFEGIAPRPRDTSWKYGKARYSTSKVQAGVENAYDQWKEIHRGSRNART